MNATLLVPASHHDHHDYQDLNVMKHEDPNQEVMERLVSQPSIVRLCDQGDGECAHVIVKPLSPLHA